LQRRIGTVTALSCWHSPILLLSSLVPNTNLRKLIHG
jgi:hypothetical protein